MGYTKVGPSPIVNFTSEYAKPLVALKTYIKAQGGGGTPSAPVAITGFDKVNVYRRGGNLWDEQREQGAIDSSGNDAADNTRIRPIGYIPVTPNTSLYVVAPTSLDIYYYDVNKTFISVEYTRNSRVINIPSNARYIRFRCGGSGYPITPSTYGHDISINYPSTDTSYHAYNPQSDIFTLPLGQTVYGGYFDWKTGKLYATYKRVLLSDLSWSRYASTPPVFYARVDDKENTNDNYVIAEGFESINDTAINVGGAASKLTSNCTIIASKGSTNPNIYLRYDEITSAANLPQALENLYCVYELATPIEIGIIPTIPTMPSTIEGEQNWFADSGDIELCYTSFIEYHKVASIFVTQNSNVQIKSASGSLVNFTTSLALPLVALKTNIVAQGGGGQPSAPVAITGWDNVNVTRAGKNLLSVNNEVITQYSEKILDTPIPAGTYTFSGTVTSNDTDSNYCFVVFVDSENQQIVTKLMTRNNPYSASITLTKPCIKIRLYASDNYNHGAGDTATYKDIQLETGTTATAYAPYNADTFTFSLGQTIYGGYVDCINGTGLKKCVKLTLDGNISTSDLRITAQTGYTRVEWYPYRDIGKGNETFKSDKFEFNTETGLYRVSNYNSTTTPRMFFGLPDSVTTREDAISWFASNPTEIVYELATPIPFSVTPTTMPQTIEGVQNWFADSGDIELEYKKIM